VRCGRCGNENNAGNRFCGMCGAELIAGTPNAASLPAPNPPLQRPPQPAVGSPKADTSRPVDRGRLDPRALLRPSAQAGRWVTQAPVAETAASQSEVRQPTEPQSAIPQLAVPPSRTERIVYDPGISGPSFLGLNQPTPRRTWEPAGTERESRHDSNLHSSGSVDYLLEDEEERGRGWGKLALVVIALALLAGFGYLRWKQGGFDFLLKNKTPEHSAEAPASGGDSGNAPTATAAPDTANPNAAAPAGTTPDSGSAGGAAAPAPGADSGNGAVSAVAPTSSPDSSAPPITPASGAPAQSSPQAGGSPPTSSPDTSAGKKMADADSGENSDEGDAESGAPAGKATADVPVKPKVQERKPSPATAADPTAEAEAYIYGRGVRQDCDRGLRLLKPAAAQANARAMISLGTLYSSGTCTPRDLPTAYRWFALALHQEPNNSTLQNEVQHLWSQMTQPERQLAVKLSH
jgi:hypothetical protein